MLSLSTAVFADLNSLMPTARVASWRLTVHVFFFGNDLQGTEYLRDSPNLVGASLPGPVGSDVSHEITDFEVSGNSVLDR